MTAKAPLIAGLGELLWDCFPEGKRPGGAPANFAFHASRLGARGVAVSRIGEDREGDELAASLARAGLDISKLQSDASHSTGSVRIEFACGQPQYEIVAPAAWDFLSWTTELAALAAECDAVCFGTLAQRAAVSRETIQRFVSVNKERKPDALRIFDVNLRQRYFSRELLLWGMERATVLKLNAEELPVLAALFGWETEPHAAIASLFERFPVRFAALTLGGDGAWLVSREERAFAKPLKVAVADTVGAGDAFAAALAVGLFVARPLQTVVDDANALGAYVASQPGAMPQGGEAIGGSL